MVESRYEIATYFDPVNLGWDYHLVYYEDNKFIESKKLISAYLPRMNSEYKIYSMKFKPKFTISMANVSLAKEFGDFLGLAMDPGEDLEKVIFDRIVKHAQKKGLERFVLGDEEFVLDSGSDYSSDLPMVLGYYFYPDYLRKTSNKERKVKSEMSEEEAPTSDWDSFEDSFDIMNQDYQ